MHLNRFSRLNLNFLVRTFAPIYRILKRLAPSCTWNKTDDTGIYITFDDGPHPTITPWVLNELDKHSAKATFFMVGDNSSKFPDIVQRVKDGNHSIGNHTFNHLKGWSNRSKKYYQNIEKAAPLTSKILFRPPYGQIRPSQIRHLKKQYNIIMWSVLSKDYLGSLDCKKALKRICKQTKPGSIIVFHDSEKAENQLKQLLPPYLNYCSKMGFEMKAL